MCVLPIEFCLHHPNNEETFQPKVKQKQNKINIKKTKAHNKNIEGKQETSTGKQSLSHVEKHTIVKILYIRTTRKTLCIEIKNNYQV